MGDDVRMRGFRERVSVEVALAEALAGLAPCAAVETGLDEAAGRVLARAVTGDVDVPGFRRAAMDGYAVCAADTYGSSAYAPAELRLVGESMPGGETVPAVAPGQAVRIMTGAPVPEGADAVLPAESASEEGGRVLGTAAVTPGKHVGAVGEDVARGTVVLPAGRRLRPQDVALLASVGCGRPPVVRRPRVVLLVTGNELLAPGAAPRGNCIVDSNTPMLRALVVRDGGEVAEALRLTDDEDVIRDALVRVTSGAEAADVLIAAGGSSVGREDFLPVLVAELGELPVHGVTMRPSAPTGVGRIGGTRVLLLPGNPVSCLAAYDFFAGPAVRTLGGLPAAWPYGAAALPLKERIASTIGRTDYVRVALRAGGVVPLAISGASILSSTTRADGFVVVPALSEGVPEGGEALVHLYDAWSLDARPHGRNAETA